MKSKNQLNKKQLQNLSCAFAQIAIKDFANTENFSEKIFCLLVSGGNFA